MMLGASVSGDLGLPPRSHGDPVMSTTQTFCHQHAQESQANLNTSITKKKALQKLPLHIYIPKEKRQLQNVPESAKPPKLREVGC